MWETRISVQHSDGKTPLQRQLIEIIDRFHISLDFEGFDLESGTPEWTAIREVVAERRTYGQNTGSDT
jgi:hypothetical protein